MVWSELWEGKCLTVAEDMMRLADEILTQSRTDEQSGAGDAMSNMLVGPQP